MTANATEQTTRVPFQTMLACSSADAHCAMLELADSAPRYATECSRLRFWLPLSGNTRIFPRHGLPYSISDDSRVLASPPGAVWEGAWQGRQTCVLLEVNDSVLREFSRAPLVFPNDRQVTLVEDERIRFSLLALHQDLLAPSPASDLFLGHIARGIASHYLKAYCSGADAGPVRAQKLAPHELQRVLELIDARLNSKLSLTELAGLLGLTVASFCRRFKNSTGLPPYQYLLHARVQRAKDALRKHQREQTSLSELALTLGFYDQSQFTNTFRKIVGVSPREYMRAQGADRALGLVETMPA